MKYKSILKIMILVFLIGRMRACVKVGELSKDVHTVQVMLFQKQMSYIFKFSFPLIRVTEEVS